MQELRVKFLISSSLFYCNGTFWSAITLEYHKMVEIDKH